MNLDPRALHKLALKNLRRSTISAVLLIGVIFYASPNVAHAVNGKYSSFELESAFVGQLMNYVELKSKTQNLTAHDSFTISVVGDSPIISDLKRMAKTKKVQGKEIRVLTANTPKSLRKSQIVVIATDDPSSLDETLNATRGSGALTISHFEGFGQKGVMVNFILDGESLKFEVNRQSVESEGVWISSQVLRLAKMVTTEPLR